MSIITFQPGPQNQFLSSLADIVVYGGAAGGGKTFSLLLESLRHIGNPRFRGVIFRKTFSQISVPGGLWDEASKLYLCVGGIANLTRHEFIFPSGATIRFAHLQHEKNIYDWQGSQVPFFGFDQIEQFSRKQFEYIIFSRGRTDSGVKPYVRVTCNPDPNSFVAKLVEWWIDSNTGLPLPERSGVIRYFVRVNEQFEWGDSPGDLKKYSELEPKTLTFISAKITDNQIGLKNNPGYIASLNTLSLVDRERLLMGNWKIRETAGNFFHRSWFEVVDTIPCDVSRVRYWDRAATKPNPTNPDPDWTVGVKLARGLSDDSIYIEHVERFRDTPGQVENRIKNIAFSDGFNVKIGLEQDPGQAGKAEIAHYEKLLRQFNLFKVSPTGNKQNRAKTCSALAEQGKLKILRGPWNNDFLNESENFPDGKHDDQVDALSGAEYMLPRPAIKRGEPKSINQFFRSQV